MKTPLLALLFAMALCAQTAKVTRVEIRTDPQGGKVRPFESIVLQVRVYGDVTDKEGKTVEGRLRRAQSKIRILQENAGWLSKPFKYQGKDDEKFLDEAESKWQSILGAVTEKFILKDSVLYTAPEKSGKFEIEASLGERLPTGKLSIEVTPGAPSVRKEEKRTFQKAGDRDPYRRLAEHYSPFIAQETWFQPKADTPARFDFDGDWKGNNNWNNLDDGSSQAYVYYAAMETASHWFLTYNVFHPRDYSDNCVAGTCHENDNEGIFLTVLKDGSEFGRLQVMETLAHNNIYSYVNEDGFRNAVHDIDGRVDLYEGSHPMVFIESGGHGIYSARDRRASFDAGSREFREATTGMTLIYKGDAARPQHAADRLVGYDLLPILEHWWPKACRDSGWKENTFDEFYTYQPFGGRPGTKCSAISGAFYGRKEAENKARPFWGWFDDRTRKKKVLNTGQWGLDPAYAVSQNLRFPSGKEPSLDYTYNPYLGVGDEGPKQEAAASAREGSCELDAVIDGSVRATLRRDNIEFAVDSGQPVSGVNFRCTAPVPASDSLELKLEKRAGRGKVELSGRPSAGNDYAVGLRIEDTQRAADRYKIIIRWKR